MKATEPPIDFKVDRPKLEAYFRGLDPETGTRKYWTVWGDRCEKGEGFSLLDVRFSEENYPPELAWTVSPSVQATWAIYWACNGDFLGHSDVYGRLVPVSLEPGPACSEPAIAVIVPCIDRDIDLVSSRIPIGRFTPEPDAGFDECLAAVIGLFGAVVNAANALLPAARELAAGDTRSASLFS